MPEPEHSTIDPPGNLDRHSSMCAVANGKLTITSKIGIKTIDAGASADVPEGKARLEFQPVAVHCLPQE